MFFRINNAISDQKHSAPFFHVRAIMRNIRIQYTCCLAGARMRVCPYRI